MIDDRRVDEDEELFAARCAALIHELEGLLGEPLRQLARIRDRRRRAQKHRVGTVMTTHTAKPPQHVTEMTAEDPAVRVQLVDDHVPQVLEQLRPARMVRQDARVHQLGIAEYKLRAPANRPPCVMRRVCTVRTLSALIATTQCQPFYS